MSVERSETGNDGGPLYRGEPLDAERGPGLGCFWVQVGLLTLLLVATPFSVWLGAPTWLSAAMLMVTLILLLFTGQTVIFLLRLVAADRRSRRRPLAPTARRTVGMLEDEAPAADGAGAADAAAVAHALRDAPGTVDAPRPEEPRT